jgi:CDP-diacylglycerol--glycerol-3-phosphate 3-phosphatidyltransferase
VGKVMAKYIPNILSVLRIILSVILILIISIRIAFLAVYITIGITDVLDGMIARKFGYESDFGARLDSIADFIFYLMLIFVFLNLFSSILEVEHKVALIVIISIRLINMLLTKLKYKKIVFVHTITNKISGFIVFLVPMVLLFTQQGIVIWTILIIVFIAGTEELLITIKCTEPNLNRKSIFFK